MTDILEVVQSEGSNEVLYNLPDNHVYSVYTTLPIYYYIHHETRVSVVSYFTGQP